MHQLSIIAVTLIYLMIRVNYNTTASPFIINRTFLKSGFINGNTTVSNFSVNAASSGEPPPPPPPPDPSVDFEFIQNQPGTFPILGCGFDGVPINLSGQPYAEIECASEKLSTTNPDASGYFGLNISPQGNGGGFRGIVRPITTVNFTLGFTPRATDLGGYEGSVDLRYEPNWYQQVTFLNPVTGVLGIIKIRLAPNAVETIVMYTNRLPSGSEVENVFNPLVGPNRIVQLRVLVNNSSNAPAVVSVRYTMERQAGVGTVLFGTAPEVLFPTFTVYTQGSVLDSTNLKKQPALVNSNINIALVRFDE